MNLQDLRIKIFADGADLATMRALNDDPLIKGLTTNPSLMRKAGITDYEAFCREVLTFVTAKPISFEVFADDFAEMERQARKIAAWGPNVYVKIPITNSRGQSTYTLMAKLAENGIKLNVTAILTIEQMNAAARWLRYSVPAIISIFNGRIMDTGREPIRPEWMDGGRESLWASTREPYNIWQADAMGYDIITVPSDILAKARKMAGMDLTALSLETVQMFARDSQGYTL